MAHRFHFWALLASIITGCSCSPDEGTDASLLDASVIDTSVADARTDDAPWLDAPPTEDVPSLDAPLADAPNPDAPTSVLDPNCDPDDVQCESLPPTCDEGEAPSVSGDCWGECIPANECRCRTLDDCPAITGYSEVCYTAGHCGPAL